MKNAFTKLMGFLVGRKTYILAGVLCLATAVLVYTGRLTPTVALGTLLIALGGFAATFRNALQRHQEDSLRLLADIAAVGVAVKNHKDIQPAVTTAAKDGYVLGEEIEQEPKN